MSHLLVASARLSLVYLLPFVLISAYARGAGGAVLPISPAQIESDWLLQERARKTGVPSSPARPEVGTVSTTQDAAGGCDGVKDGTYGFHTLSDAAPWWQVDLGKPTPLAKVVIYNRCDGGVEGRAGRLAVLLSTDGSSWREAYCHDGTPFSGYPNGDALTVLLNSATSRFVRIQLPGPQYLHLDEVEVYAVRGSTNVALNMPADQSSVSPWSRATPRPAFQGSPQDADYPVVQALARGLALASSLWRAGVDVDSARKDLERLERLWQQHAGDVPLVSRRKIYLATRWATRRMALANPLLDFDDLLFVKRVPGSFTHMSDQYYGWFSRPGGGLFVLEGFKTDSSKLRCLTEEMADGSVLRPDISFDGERVLFAHCKYYPHLAAEPDKLNKANIPEDAFYHLYEMDIDASGSSASKPRRLTSGKYDHFDGRYLPDGRIVFLSTRRGQSVQCGRIHDAECIDAPDSYVRCGGGPGRPVAVYTLHVMNSDGGGLVQISPFEMFEWTPSIDHDGRILYSRWDYVDRHNMPYMSLWSTLPDGSNAQALFGNYTRNPHCVFEPRVIPNSHKLIFTASAHHGLTAGSLVLLDPRLGTDGDVPMTRLTPEVCFPESEGWPQSYYANPYPLSEEHYLVAWSGRRLPPGVPPPAWGSPGPPNDLGLYLFDAFGNLDLIYRDADISSVTPLPLKPRPSPPALASEVSRNDVREGRMLVVNVNEGLPDALAGTVCRLRLVGVPAKTHPTINHPNLGLTGDDPGKFVMGTVPVEADGSAYFHVPAGVTFFLQALDKRGLAVQTMRSATYVQAGQTYACIGCHEQRHTAPPVTAPLAMTRAPSRITPGAAGSWPLDYRQLVQPVLDRQCVSCHCPEGKAARWDLVAARSYETLVHYGKPSLCDHVKQRYAEGRSVAGSGAAQTNPLLPLLEKGHYDVRLTLDERSRLLIWMDTYGQRLGSFDKRQEDELLDLRRGMAGILTE